MNRPLTNTSKLPLFGTARSAKWSARYTPELATVVAGHVTHDRRHEWNEVCWLLA